MAKITNDMVHAAYKIAKQVSLDHNQLQTGLNSLEHNHHMNRNSANDYIYTYDHMVKGERYTRTINNYATEYFLHNIQLEGGESLLLNSLSALMQHIEYYEAFGNTVLRQQREIHNQFSQRANIQSVEIYPDEIYPDMEDLREGKGKKVYVNVYERNPAARQQCINHYGCLCCICGFNFEETFGEIGASFIHVHHLVELSTIGKEYSIDPINDLKPVCPNCHAMIHKRKPAYSIEEIRQYLVQ